MKQTTRRIERLERAAGTKEPYIISVHKTIIGMDGEVERTEEKTITAGAASYGGPSLLQGRFNQ